MKAKFENLKKKIIGCRKCPRLIQFRNKILNNKRKQYKNEKYWGKPITGFGDLNGKILFVGLAPAAHGATRTGRIFTGDKSSEFLYKCLYKAKISNKETANKAVQKTPINALIKLVSAFHKSRKIAPKIIPAI